MTLANGIKYVAAGHASVSEVSFKILNSRRVMLRVKRADGTPLAKGYPLLMRRAIISSPAWMTAMCLSMMPIS